MSLLVGTQLPGSIFGNLGKLFRVRLAVGDVFGSTYQTVEMTLPTGVVATDLPGSPPAIYRRRAYLVGSHTENLVKDEFGRIHRQAIPAPTLIPVLAAGAAGGRSGKCRVRVAFYDAKTDEWGALSGPSNEVTLADQKASITNLPTTAPESRVTHIGVFVQMDGATYRLAATRQLGVTTIVEGVATLALGMAEPISFTRLPRGTVNAIYHDRQCVAGDFKNPDVLYVSAPFKPERYEGLSFRTRDGAPIVMLVSTRDVLLVFTPRSVYTLRGYTEDDMSMNLLDAEIGAISARGYAIIHGNAIIVNDRSIFYYNGAFHNILKDREEEWQYAVEQHTALYEAGFAVFDPNDYTFTYMVTGHNSSAPAGYIGIFNPAAATLQTIGWTADVSSLVPELTGESGQPDWNMDIYSRRIRSGVFAALPGVRRGDVYFGFCDGYVRKKDRTNDDDDGDDYGKRFFFRSGHLLMDAGGDVEAGGGKTMNEMWAFVQAEMDAWTLYVKGGDEDAWRMITPDNTTHWYKADFAAARLTDSSYEYAAKSVHPLLPARCSGRGFTIEVTALAPRSWPPDERFEMRGFGGVFGPGPATRPAVEAQGGGG